MTLFIIILPRCQKKSTTLYRVTRFRLDSMKCKISQKPMKEYWISLAQVFTHSKGIRKAKRFYSFLQVCLWQSFLLTNSNTWIYGTFYFLKCLWNPYPSRFFDSLNCHLKPDYPAFRCTKKFCSSSYSFGIASNLINVLNF